MLIVYVCSVEGLQDYTVYVYKAYELVSWEASWGTSAGLVLGSEMI